MGVRLCLRRRAQMLGQHHASLSYRNLMSPTGWEGAFHTNERFLFGDLSEWVTASAAAEQVICLERGGMKTNVPAT